MNISDRLRIKEKRKGEYYKQCVKSFGKKEANRIAYKAVMGFYPEEKWMFGAYKIKK